jgi:hypothetical protein
MTQFLPCHMCRKPFKENDLMCCYNCDKFYCAACDGTDERACGCAPLCVTCREPPNQCTSCGRPGCMLCMGNGCCVCQDIKLDAFRFRLVCDDCRCECSVCKRMVCIEHVTTARSVDKNTGICGKSYACVDCTHEALANLVAKRSSTSTVLQHC